MTRLTMCHSHTLATLRPSHRPSPSSASYSPSSGFPTSSPSASQRRSGLDTTGRCNVRWTTPVYPPILHFLVLSCSNPSFGTKPANNLLHNSTPPPPPLLPHLLLHLLLLALLATIPRFVLHLSLSPNPSIRSQSTATRLPTFRLGRRRA